MNIEKFINDYLNYLKDNLTVKKLENIHEITLPFFDRNNDALTLYVEQYGNKEYRITDDAYIINNLEDCGLIITPKRMDTIHTICNKLGISIDNKELYILSEAKDIVNKVHILTQAMLRVDDLYLTSQNRTASYFIEDLIDFFDKKEIYYARDISYIGKTGVTHTFDFLFQRSKNNPERVCRAINYATKNNMINVLFAWEDIEKIKNKESKLIVIINDRNNIDENAITGFKNYNVDSFMWSDLDKNLKYFQ